MISEMDKMEEETYNTSHTRIIFYDYMGTEYFDVGNGVAKDNESIYRKSHDSSWTTADGKRLDSQGNPMPDPEINDVTSSERSSLYEGKDRLVYGMIPGELVDDENSFDVSRGLESAVIGYMQSEMKVTTYPNELTLVDIGSELNDELNKERNNKSAEGIEMDGMVAEARQLILDKDAKEIDIIEKRIELEQYARLHNISEYSDKALMKDLDLILLQFSAYADAVKMLDETKALHEQRYKEMASFKELEGIDEKVKRLQKEVDSPALTPSLMQKGLIWYRSQRELLEGINGT